MSTYLYRAVCIEHVDNAYNGEPVYWPGSILGRQTGYLSRSGAVSAGQRAQVAFDVVRSEPVVFLTREQKLERDIAGLTQQLEAIRSAGA